MPEGDTPLAEPEPPESAPKYLLDGLEKQSADTLRQLATYADRLADYHEAQAERELEERADDDAEIPEEWDADEWDDALEDVEDAPSGATRTKKTIDGRQYYYYQWREGDKIKSEYIAPVVPSASE